MKTNRLQSGNRVVIQSNTSLDHVNMHINFSFLCVLHFILFFICFRWIPWICLTMNFHTYLLYIYTHEQNSTSCLCSKLYLTSYAKEKVCFLFFLIIYMCLQSLTVKSLENHEFFFSCFRRKYSSRMSTISSLLGTTTLSEFTDWLSLFTNEKDNWTNEI